MPVHSLSSNIIVVDGLPDDANVLLNQKHNQLEVHGENGQVLAHGLPPGNYTIIGKGDAIDEEQANEMVDISVQSFRLFANYADDNAGCDTALESLSSWFLSKSLNPSNCILLKKEV